MQLTLSESQELVRESVHNYLADHYEFTQHLALLEKNKTPVLQEQWQSMAELGWLSIALTEEQGGLGGSALDAWALMNSMGSSLCPAPLLSNAIIVAPLLAASRSPLAQEVLQALTSGKVRIALAHTESAHYKAEEKINTTATLTAEGYLLSGHKTLVPDAGHADYLIVPARIDEASLGLFLIPKQQTGMKMVRLPMADATSAADIKLEQVHLPATHLLFSKEEAQQQLNLALARAIAGQTAQSVGAMQAVLDLTRQYMHDRSQFGRSLAAFQALQHRYADMVIAYERAYSMSILAANSVDHLNEDPATHWHALHQAKVVVGQSARFIGAEGIQLHGGMGMTQEYPVGHYYRKLLVNDSLYGSHQAHLSALI